MVPGGGKRGSTGVGMPTGAGGGVVVVALLGGGLSRRSASRASACLRAGALGEVAFGQRLPAPGDAFDEPGAVTGVGGFTEEVSEALPQLGDAQALQGGDLVDDVHLHRVLLCRGLETVNPCGQ